jgi:Uma2 family endonuclease
MFKIPQGDPPPSPKEALPSMYDLPSESPEDSGMPDVFHLSQPALLSETFRPPAHDPDQVFVASDLNLYYDLRHTNWYKRPDWFAVVGVPRLYEGHDLRLSYVVWQEGRDPIIVVELLSPGTEKEDLGQTLRSASEPPTKWEVYEQILKVPYYVVFDRYTDRLRIFQLTGARYAEVSVAEGRLWLAPLELGLGLWEGTYQGTLRLWLRWYDAAGNWIPTLEERAQQERERAQQERERAQQERERAEQERERAEQERERAERLAARLRELGEDPESLR